MSDNPRFWKECTICSNVDIGSNACKCVPVISRLAMQEQMDKFINPTKVKVKKLHQDAVVPSYSKIGDAGFDLTAISKEVLGDRVIYGFGLAFEVPKDHFMMIVPRSSICKKDLYLTNHCGIVDSGYRGEVKAVFRIDPVDDSMYGSLLASKYDVGDRIAQGIILPFPSINFIEVTELSSSKRGKDGFGSTGK